MATIRVTPETLQKQGNDILGYAENITEVLSQLDKMVNTICDEWDGAAQDAFFVSYGEMKSALDQFPKVVEGIGNQAIGAAQAYASVDDELKNAYQSN